MLVESLESLRQYVIRDQMQIRPPTEMMDGIFYHNLEAFGVLFGIALLVGLVSVPFSEENITADIFVLKMLQVFLFVALVGLCVEAAVTIHNELVVFLWPQDQQGLSQLTVDLSLEIGALAAVIALLLLAFLFGLPALLVMMALVFFLFAREFFLWTIFYSSPIIGPMLFLDFGPFKMVSQVPKMMIRVASYMLIISIMTVIIAQVSIGAYGAFSDDIDRGEELPNHDELLEEVSPEVYQNSGESRYEDLTEEPAGNLDIRYLDGVGGLSGMDSAEFDVVDQELQELSEKHPDFQDPREFSTFEEVSNDLTEDQLYAGTRLAGIAATAYISEPSWEGPFANTQRIEGDHKDDAHPFTSEQVEEARAYFTEFEFQDDIYFLGYYLAGEYMFQRIEAESEEQALEKYRKQNDIYDSLGVGPRNILTHEEFFRLVYTQGPWRTYNENGDTSVVEVWMRNDPTFADYYLTAVSSIGQLYGSEAGLLEEAVPSREIPLRAALYECKDIESDYNEVLEQDNDVGNDYNSIYDSTESIGSPGENFNYGSHGVMYDPEQMTQDDEFMECVADVESEYGLEYAGETYIWDQPYMVTINRGGGVDLTEIPVAGPIGDATMSLGKGAYGWVTDPGGQIRDTVSSTPEELPDPIEVQSEGSGQNTDEPSLGAEFHRQASNWISYNNDVEYTSTTAGDIRECSVAGDGIQCVEGVNAIDTFETFMFWLIGYLLPAILFAMGLRAATSPMGATLPVGRGIRSASSSRSTVSGSDNDRTALATQAKAGLQKQDTIDVNKAREGYNKRVPWKETNGGDTTDVVEGGDTTDVVEGGDPTISGEGDPGVAGEGSPNTSGNWNTVGAGLGAAKGAAKRGLSGGKHMTVGGGWKQSPIGWAKSGLNHFRENPIVSKPSKSVKSKEDLEKAETGGSVDMEGAYIPEKARFRSVDGTEKKDVKPGSDDYQELEESEEFEFQQERGYLHLKEEDAEDGETRVPVVAFDDAQQNVEKAREKPIEAKDLRKRIHDRSKYDDGDGWGHDKIDDRQYEQVEITKNAAIETKDLF